MRNQLMLGNGIDLVSQLRSELERRLNGTGLTPGTKPNLVLQDWTNFQEATQANLQVEIPRTTRMARYRTQRIERFPDGRVVDERKELCFEESTELFTGQGDLFILGGNSVLDRLLDL